MAPIRGRVIGPIGCVDGDFLVDGLKGSSGTGDVGEKNALLLSGGVMTGLGQAASGGRETYSRGSHDAFPRPPPGLPAADHVGHRYPFGADGPTVAIRLDGDSHGPLERRVGEGVVCGHAHE